MAGCKSKHILVSYHTTDSVKITDTYAKQNIIVPGDSVRITLPVIIEENRPRPAVMKATGNRAKLKVELTNEGMIEASANCDEYEVQVDVLQRTIDRYRQDVSVFQDKESALQRTIRDLQVLLKMAALVLVVLGVWKYVKPAITIIKTILKPFKNK